MSALSVQLSELEMLQSMFSPSELRLEPGLIESMKSTLDTDQLAWPLVSFIINLDVEVTAVIDYFKIFAQLLAKVSFEVFY